MTSGTQPRNRITNSDTSSWLHTLVIYHSSLRQDSGLLRHIWVEGIVDNTRLGVAYHLSEISECCGGDPLYTMEGGKQYVLRLSSYTLNVV